MTHEDDRPEQLTPPTELGGGSEPELTLRQQAERIARHTPAPSPEAIAALSREDIQRTVHALRVHQIELEMRNEELRRTQVELEATRVRYLDLYEGAPVGYCILSEPGLIREANPTAARLLGLARGELIAQPLARFILTEDQAVYDLFRLSLFESPTEATADSGSAGGPGDCTLRILKPDGAIVWARLEAIAAMDADGSLVGRVTISDFTLSKQVEALQNTLERSQSIVDDTLDWQSWFGLDGRYLWVSPAVEQLTGYTPEEVMDMPDWASVLIAEEDWPVFRETFRGAINGSRGTGLQIRYVRKDGVKRWISVDWKPIVDAQGKLLGTRSSGRDIAGLKLTEETLRRSQSMLERTEAMARVGSWEWEVAADTVVWSDELYRILQRDPADGAPSFADHAQIYPPEDMLRLSDAVVTAINQGTPYELELHAKCRDGATRTLLTRGYADMDAKQGVSRLVGCVQDITERHAAEQTLRDSEQRFHAMFMNAPLCILIHDADTGEMLEANPTACVRYGYVSFEALKANFDQLWIEPPYSIEDCVRWAIKTIKKGPQQFEWCYRHADGTLRWDWVHLSTIVMQDKVCILAMTVDINSEKRIRTELQASEARARAIIDASPMPFAIAYETGATVYLNPAFVADFGYTLEEIPTWSDWRLKAYPDPDYRQRIVERRREAVQHAARTGGVCEPAEIVVCCKDSRRRTLMARATPLDTSAEILYLNTFYDVTDLKQAQAAAEQSARVKSEFLANMSHEIRTPLNAMLGLSQLLENDGLTADQRHLVKRLRAAGRSLLGLVNDILDASKLESGQFRLETRTFAPAAVLAQIESLLGQQARAKGLSLQLDTPVGLAPWLVGDPSRLEQILMNLVGNAVKFTESGEVRIHVNQQDIDTTTVRLRLEVSDTGIGIAPEDLTLLGTPFTQADGSITRRFGGTGLGLAISKQLVERMGGAFGVDSTLGVGSTFRCELPFARANDNDTPPQEAAPAERRGGRLNGVHCLVVDDSLPNREVVERALAREGARATLANDGRQALDWLCAHPDEVVAVLMDIQMPVMDGLTATRAIRQALGLTALPVIALSAGVLAEQRQEAREAGISDFLAKPVDLEDLVAMLQRWCATPAPGASRPIRAPARTPDEATRTDFPDIPGLDTRQAARLLGNDWALFLRLLSGLITDFNDVAQRTRDDLARGAVADAAGRLHTLQGRAGYIGAQELVRTAQTLELRLLEGSPDLKDIMDAFEGQLAALLAALRPWLEQPTPPAADAVAATALDPTQLAALHAALTGCDLAALALFDALEPALIRRDGQAATAALAAMIRSLRFDEALALMAPEPQPDQAA